MSDGGAIRVVLVDDEVAFAELLAAALDEQPDLETAGIAPTLEHAVPIALHAAADVVVLRLPVHDGGLDAVHRLRRLRPATRVLLLRSDADASSVRRAMATGAAGCLPKASGLREILHAVRVVGSGRDLPDGEGHADRSDVAPHPADRAHLTRRELDVLACLASGMDTRATAKALGITTNTCQGYVKVLYVKLGAHSRLEAVVRAVHLGLLSDLGAG